MNNKTLAIVLVVLIALFLLSKIFNKKTDRSFVTEIIQIDTSAVNKVVFHPKAAEGQGYELNKTNGTWQVSNGSITATATQASINSLLSNVNNITANRIVAKSEDKWLDYEVNAEKGQRIEFKNGSNTLEDLVIGRFNFNQQTRSATSYIRRNNDSNVYAIDGFMSMSLNQDMNSFRNKELARLSKDEIIGLELTEAGVTKSAEKENLWVRNDRSVIDSTKVAQYLQSLSSINGSAFVDGFDFNSNSKIKSLKVSSSGSADLTIDCYQSNSSEQPFVIHSSANSDAYFSSDSTGIFKRLFLDLNFL